jgi:hypothetical protein
VTYARSVFVLFVVFAVAGGAARADKFKSRFSFKVPDGWLDKSAPETRDLLTIAFDEPNQLVFQAKVHPGAEPITPEFLDGYAAKAQESVKKRVKAGDLKVVSKLLMKIGPVIAARFLFEMTPPPDVENPQVVRQLVVYVPAGDQSATLTFTAPQETYAKFEPLFDKTARSTLIRK